MARFNRKRVYLWGGIGNVLFQLNFVYYLISLGYNVEVSTLMLGDKGFVSNFNKHHKGTLSIFLMLEKHFEVRINVRSGMDFRDLQTFLLKKLRFNILGFRSFEHNIPEKEDIDNAHLLIGYFQRLPWRSDILKNAVVSLVKEQLEVLNLPNFPDENSLVVHLRLGDKTDDKDFYLNPERIERIFLYYKTVYIVSDSPDRIEDYINNSGLVGTKLINYSSKDPLEDFIKLYKAPNIVLSRSTFSWWAAELNEDNVSIYEPCPFYSHLNWSPYTIKTNKKCL